MSSQIIFFEKNWADFEKSTVVVTASQGNDLASKLVDRSNRTAWGTAGSVDADNTSVILDSGDVSSIDSVLMLKHNFKDFLLEYFDATFSIWTTIINVVGNTKLSNYYDFAAVQTQKIRLTIFGTMTPNDEKLMCQFIMTLKIGKLNGWPVISSPILGRNILTQPMLSGKSNVTNNIGSHSTTLSVSNWSDAADLAVVERLFNFSEGFLYWPCGGNEDQFRSVRQGYRLEDLFLCRCVNELSPEWVQGLYKSGMKMQLDLVEVVT